MRLFGLLLCLLGLISISFAGPVTKLRVGDKVKVVILEATEYSSTYTVLEDGSLVGVGFGRIVVEGKTIKEATKLITDEMKKILVDPHVSLILDEQKKQFIFVTSILVASPGPIDFQDNLDLRQAISKVATPDQADLYDVHLFRNGKQLLMVKLSDLLNGRGEGGRTKLEPNDVVTIADRPSIRVWVSGSVLRQGEQKLPEGANAYQAISMAGGVTADQQDSAVARILIKRGESVYDLPIQQKPGEDPIKLSAGDTVIVRIPAYIKVSFSGEVKMPDEKRVREGTTLTSALAQTGGLTPTGTLRDVMVLRKGEAFLVDATPLVEGRAPKPFPLEDGDLIYVNRNERKVLTLGFVSKPGWVFMADARKYRLADIIGEAGGPNSRGSFHHVYLARKDERGKLVSKDYQLDNFLKSGDLSQNPEIQDGDVVMMGQPRGFDQATVSQALYIGILFNSVFKR